MRFLDEANKLPDVITSKPIIISGLKLTGGERVLDLGYGLGDDTFEIALTEMSKIALAHGATVDKFIGDAIVAFFGDPVSQGAACRSRGREGASLGLSAEFIRTGGADHQYPLISAPGLSQ